MATSSTGAIKRTSLRDRLVARMRRPRTPAGMFLAGFIKHPVMVGSIIPSSPRLIRRMLAPVDWASVKLFVEYGPGVGTFCGPILERLGPDARLIAIDTNCDFVDFLDDTIRDPRFTAVLGSAADVEQIVADAGFSHADYILSGLPFSTLPPGVGDAIAEATFRALKPGGAFLAYQFSPKVRNFIARQTSRIDHAFEVGNIPPCQLYWGWREA